jgi:hypothetical protein
LVGVQYQLLQLLLLYRPAYHLDILSLPLKPFPQMEIKIKDFYLFKLQV